jgi:hypothetical protein
MSNLPEVFALLPCGDDLSASQGSSDLCSGCPYFAEHIVVFYRFDLLDPLSDQVQVQKMHNARDWGFASSVLGRPKPRNWSLALLSAISGMTERVAVTSSDMVF